MKKTLKLLLVFFTLMFKLALAEETNFVQASIKTTAKIDYVLIILIGVFVLLSLLIIYIIFKVLFKNKYKKRRKISVKHSSYTLPQVLYEKPETVQEKKDDKYEELIIKRLENQSKLDEDFERFLKEDEKEVINILKLRDGMCEQGTIQNLTGYSKAKISELVKELNSRKIVFKRKKGRKNIILLRSL